MKKPLNIAGILIKYNFPIGGYLYSPVCGKLLFQGVEGDVHIDVECRICCKSVSTNSILRFDKFGHLVSSFGVSEVPMLFLPDGKEWSHLEKLNDLIVIAINKVVSKQEVVEWQPKILGKVLYKETVVNPKLGINVKMWKAGLIEFIWKNCHVDNEIYTKVSLIGDTRVFRIDEDIIPLKGNEHLAHTTQKPNKKYKAVIK